MHALLRCNPRPLLYHSDSVETAIASNLSITLICLGQESCAEYLAGTDPSHDSLHS